MYNLNNLSNPKLKKKKKKLLCFIILICYYRIWEVTNILCYRRLPTLLFVEVQFMSNISERFFCGSFPFFILNLIFI